MQLMTPRDAGRLTGWTPGQIDLMIRNGLTKYYRQGDRILVDLGKLYELKVKAIKQQARVKAKQQAMARAQQLKDRPKVQAKTQPHVRVFGRMVR